MRIRFLVLAAIFLNCVRAFGGPALAVEEGNMVVTVPAGRSVVWLSWSYVLNYPAAGFATDTDGDGRIVIEPPLWDVRYSDWVVTDAATGEYTKSTLYPMTEEELPPGSIIRGTNGAYSQLVLPSAFPRATGAVWIRPGAGAWTPGGGKLDGRRIDMRLFASTTGMHPMGPSPATPAGFERGDLLLTLSQDRVRVARADVQLDAANPGTISFVGEIGHANEGVPLEIELMRLGGAEGTVSVRCCTAAGTAQPGIDFTALDRVITFAPGELFQTFSLSLVDDQAFLQERPTLTVGLHDPTGGALVGAPAVQRVGILENDPEPVVGFGDVPATVPEGDTPWTLPIPVTATGAFRGSYTSYSQIGEKRMPLVFAEGQVQRTFDCPIPADDVAGANVDVRLAAGPARRSFTIIDDDAPELRTTDTSTAEGSEFVIAHVQLSAPAAANVYAQWTTVDGTAKAGVDFEAASGKAMLPDSGAIRIRLLDDGDLEEAETFTIELTTITGAPVTVVRSSLTVTIFDDDAPAPAVTITPVSVTEGNAGEQQTQLELRLATASSSAALFSVTTGGGTATADVDYRPFAGSVTFVPGQTSAFVTVTTFGDVADEANETFDVTVSEKGVARTTATLTILDDDTSSFISVHPTSFLEGTGASSVALFRVTLAPPPATSCSVAYATEEGTASGGPDYAPSSGTLVFAPGERERTIAVEVFGDALTEGDETFELRLSGVTGAYLQADHAAATVYDDDGGARPFLTIDDHTVFESGAEESFEVRLSAPADADTRVSWATRSASAIPPADYEHRSGTVTIPAGATTATIAIRITGDVLAEPDEQFAIELSRPDGAAIARSTALCTIVDDDAAKRRTVRH